MRFSAWARFLVIFSLSIFLFFLTSTSTFAQDKTAPILLNNSTQNLTVDATQKSYPVPNTNSNVPNNLHNWTQNVMIETMSALTCQLAGIDPINPKQPCLGADAKSGKIGFLPPVQKGGAIGFMGTMIASLYTPPLHTGDYFQNLAQNFGITKKTYAQAMGTGFQGIIPFINVWIAFRNIVYLLLVIIFAVIGLGIMLRIKIDPRTVMTIQNQIPKIIIGILAVTFSFAIAGFLIDMMWVFTYLIYSVISGIPGANVANLNPTTLQNQTAIGAASAGISNIAGLANQVASDGSTVLRNLLGLNPTGTTFTVPGINSIYDLIPAFSSTLNPGGTGINFIVDTISAVVSWTVALKFLNLPSPTVLAENLGWIANVIFAIPGAVAVNALTELFLRFGLPYLVIFLVMLITLLTALFRLWFMLLKAYVSILLGVVLAPFWIIGGVLPGSQISFGGWLKDMIANLLAFPVVIAMFLLASIFMDIFGHAAAGTYFLPPLIGDPGTPNLIGSLIALGIILITPNVVNMLKQILKTPKTDLGIGKAFAPGVAMPGRAVKGVGGLAFGDAVNRGFLEKEGSPRSTIGRFIRAFG
jgi:hypothetical protein